MPNSLRPYELQQDRLPCSLLFPGICSNSCPLSQWCHPTISSSVSPSPPALNVSQHQGLFQWVSSLHQVAKVLELQLKHQSFQLNIQGWFPLRLTDLIVLSNGPSRVFSSTTNQKHQFFSTHSVFFMGQLSHPYMTTRKTIALTIWTFVGKVIPLLFNTLSRFAIVSFQGARVF